MTGGGNVKKTAVSKEDGRLCNTGIRRLGKPMPVKNSVGVNYASFTTISSSLKPLTFAETAVPSGIKIAIMTYSKIP
ncbi:MAG: hypothetical protein Kow0080_03540 [Candidatus Promineifilaceae bacterium]